MSRLFTAAALCSGLVLSQPASAEGVFLLGANVNTDADAYGYVGGVLPMPYFGGSLKQSGPLLRLWADGVSFDYSTVIGGTNREVDGTGFGLEAEVGYQWLTDSTRISAYVGPRLRITDTDPDDPGNDSDQDNLGLKAQLEILTSLSPSWSLSAMGSYAFGLDDYWARLRPGYRWNDKLTIGPELSMSGGEKYDKQRVGLYASGYRLGSGSIGVKLGWEHDAREDDDHGYLGADFSLPF